MKRNYHYKFNVGQVVEIALSGLHHPVGTRFKIIELGCTTMIKNDKIVRENAYWGVNLDKAEKSSTFLHEEDLIRHVSLVPDGWRP